jgi:uncharacterized protein (TIGR03083 family)
MTMFEARRSLEIMDGEQVRLCERLAGLTQSELQSASNLEGWSIADLGVHITRVCDSILLAVKRATVGETTPAFGPAARPREEQIRAMGPTGWAELQRSECAELTRLVSSLSPEQIEQCTFPHSQGERSIGWFCSQNLAEVAYHRWDLDRSLGQARPLDDDLAAYLLPFLLDPPRLLFRRNRADGEPQVFALSTGTQTWLLNVTADGTTVGPSDAEAQATITAPPGWLALAVYGRVRVAGPAFRVTGPSDTADRFAAIFGPRSLAS